MGTTPDQGYDADANAHVADNPAPPRSRPQPLRRRAADKRMQRRIVTNVEQFDIEALLRPDDVPGVTIVARVGDVSAGGCKLIVAPWTLEVLAAGHPCSVGLPVSQDRIHQYPATVLGLVQGRDNRERVYGRGEAGGDASHDILLRLRFLRTDRVAQAMLTRWVNNLAVRAWYT